MYIINLFLDDDDNYDDVICTTTTTLSLHILDFVFVEIFMFMNENDTLRIANFVNVNSNVSEFLHIGDKNFHE